MIKSFSGQVVLCFAILRALSAYVGKNWLSQYTFVEIDHEIISSHSPPFRWMNHSRRVVVSYEWKYVHEVLVNRLFKLAVRWTDRPVMTTAVDWDVKQQNKQTKTMIYR